MTVVLLDATGASLDTLGDLTARSGTRGQEPPIDTLTVASTIWNAR